MAFDAFISYSHVDKATADAACSALEAAGIRCWIAPRDIVPGREWGAAIVEAIDHCRVMVLIFSSSANESRQIYREVERAISNGVPVVPMRIEDVRPTESLAYFMNAVHWLDALTPPIESHLQRLAEAVKALLKISVRPARGPESTGETGPSEGAVTTGRIPTGNAIAALGPSAVASGPPQETSIVALAVEPATRDAADRAAVEIRTVGEEQNGGAISARVVALIVVLGIAFIVAAIGLLVQLRNPSPGVVEWVSLPLGTHFANVTRNPIPTFIQPDRSSERSADIRPGQTIPPSGTDQVLERASIKGEAWLRFPLGDAGKLGYVPEAGMTLLARP